MKIKDIENKLASRQDRSTWDKAVTQYALDILCDLDYLERDPDFDIGKLSVKELESVCLNGANDWRMYSFGGCALCYNYDIQERLYPKSQWRKYPSGEKLLYAQSRALQSAFTRIKRTIISINYGD